MWNGLVWQYPGGYHDLVIGGTDFTDTNYWWAQTTGAFPGSTSGFAISMSFIIEYQQSGNAGGRDIISTFASNRGFQVRFTGNNEYLHMVLFNGSGSAISPVAVPGAIDVGVPRTAMFIYTGTQALVYFRGLDIGGATTVGYAVPSPALNVWLGRGVSPTNPNLWAQDFTMLGFAYHNAVPTFAEYLLMNAQTMAWGGRLQAVPGKTSHLYDLTADAYAARLINSITDRVGSAHFTKNGSPSVRLL